MATNYITAEKKEEMVERLKARFPSEIASVIVDFVDEALNDFLVNEVQSAIDAATTG